MKHSKGKLIALLLFFAIFNILMISYSIGTLGATQTQYIVNQGSSSVPLTLKELGPDPIIFIENSEYSVYKCKPTISAWFEDDIGLDSAYYQVDTDTPTGTDIENWTKIFEDLDNKTYGNSFEMNATIFESLSEGQHYLYLKVWDDGGNVTSVIFLCETGTETKANWPFFKDITPPAYLELKSPRPDEVVSGKFSIDVDTADTSGGSGILVVKFFIDDTNIGEIWESPYNLIVSAEELSAGTHKIKIKAYDVAWNYIEKEIAIKVEHADYTLLIALLSVGSIAGVATTVYVVKYRHRPDSYKKTVSKLSKIKQPMPSEISPSLLSESEEPSYVIPGTSENMIELSDKLDQLPISVGQKEELSSELQGIPYEERIPLFNSIMGPLSAAQAKEQLNSLIKEIENLEQEGKWAEVLNKLDKGVELAEFLGDQTLFDRFLDKIDEIVSTKEL